MSNIPDDVIGFSAQHILNLVEKYPDRWVKRLTDSGPTWEFDSGAIRVLLRPELWAKEEFELLFEALMNREDI